MEEVSLWFDVGSSGSSSQSFVILHGNMLGVRTCQRVCSRAYRVLLECVHSSKRISSRVGRKDVFVCSRMAVFVGFTGIVTQLPTNTAELACA